MILRRRVASLLVVAVMAAVLGVALTAKMGRNFHAAGGPYGDFGDIYRVALPKGVTSVDEVRSFEVEIGGADDFVRAILNGYVEINSEDTEIVQKIRGGDDDAADVINRAVAVDRQTRLLGRRDLQFGLVPGWNHLVVEIENYGGPCGGGVHLYVNGEALMGVPIALPVRESMTSGLKGQPDFVRPRPHAEKALCARVAYQFYLD
jgi:hypothetical protein